MSESAEDLVLLGDRSDDAIAESLSDLIPVVSKIDRLRQEGSDELLNASQMYHKSESRFYIFLVLSVSLFMLGIGLFGLFWDGRDYTLSLVFGCLFVIAGLVFLVLAMNKRQAMMDSMVLLPQKRVQAKESLEKADALRQQYLHELQIIPADYQHERALTRLISIFEDDDLSFDETAEQYEQERHRQIIKNLRAQQVGQLRRRNRTEKMTNLAKAANLVEGTHVLNKYGDKIDELNQKIDGLEQSHMN
ncbi:DUF308 domain-containing protein [Bifidobacterium sp. ESL0764]|uniref:DUF308 domain-containing protein n=1 Tax=Bifidobacterium sp. ESL0764 TaxID=2983228 RepID=UPI0023F737E2|nr:DUF308 domain-containing protein [Bifidobacterium sp. ESL0764]WEV65242.1 DUF308 domain-containing protein [Bifidobacterium sp. ESL0764]